MADPISFSLAKMTIPVTMIGSIIGGSAWLTTTRSDVNHLTEVVEIHIVDYKKYRDKTYDSQKKTDEKLSRMEGKQDLILKQLSLIERRINSRRQ